MIKGVLAAHLGISQLASKAANFGADNNIAATALSSAQAAKQSHLGKYLASKAISSSGLLQQWCLAVPQQTPALARTVTFWIESLHYHTAVTLLFSSTPFICGPKQVYNKLQSVGSSILLQGLPSLIYSMIMLILNATEHAIGKHYTAKAEQQITYWDTTKCQKYLLCKKTFYTNAIFLLSSWDTLQFKP